MSDLDYGYMMGDGRRCRRCKRRRLDDEPPEVRQYKTCAKCRIIEREKKKLKKPLTEETMIYGMKQFREDQQNPLYNNPHDYFDVIQDKYADKYPATTSTRSTPAPVATFVAQPQPEIKQRHHQPSSMSPGQVKFQVNPQHHNPVATNFLLQFKYPNNIYVGDSRNNNTRGTYNKQQQQQQPYNLALLQYVQSPQVQIPQQTFQQPQYVGNLAALRSLYLRQNQNQYQSQQQQQQPLQQQLGSLGLEEPGKQAVCSICSTKLNPSDEMCMSYSLCFQCLVDPYQRELVFETFGDFVARIQQERYKDLKVVYFIKEIDPQFIYDLATTGKTINNEKQFRDFLLEMLETIYLKVVIASSGYDFVQFKTNTSDIRTHQQLPLAHSQQAQNSEYFASQYKDLNPIKSWYKCSKDLSAKCESTLYINYNPKLNLLFIKFSHRAHDLSIEYSKMLIDIILKIMDRLKHISEQNSEQQNGSDNIPAAEIGYNIATAYTVYDKLVSQKLHLPVEEQAIVEKLTKVDFVSDFLQFEKAIAANEQKHKEKEAALANGDTQEGKEGGHEEEEGEEDDDDDDEDLVEVEEEEIDDEDESEDDDDDDDDDLEVTQVSVNQNEDEEMDDVSAEQKKPDISAAPKVSESQLSDSIPFHNGTIGNGPNGTVKELDPTFGE